MQPRVSLTVYLLRKWVRDFREALADKDALAVEYRLPEDFGFEARLYVVQPQPKLPPWLDFLEPGFGHLAELLESAANRALLVLKVKRGSEDRFLALPFGFGRFMLRPDCYEHQFGLKVALNLIYEGDNRQRKLTRAIPQVLQVRSTRIGGNVLRTLRQANRPTTFDTFGVDIRRDMLGAVTGAPQDHDHWGTRITGSAAAYVKPRCTLRLLGDLSHELMDISEREDYKTRFSWIDSIHPVADKALVSTLTSQVLQRLDERDLDKIELAPPEILDYEKIADLSIWLREDEGDQKVASFTRVEDLDLAGYLATLEGNGAAKLTLEDLEQRYWVYAVDDMDETLGRWPLFQWLDTEVTHPPEVTDQTPGKAKTRDITYVLLAGEFYRVDPNYLNRLDRFVNRMSEWTHPLPKAEAGKHEDDYNKTAAKSSKLLCLDRKTVTVPDCTGPIEICDLLSRIGAFVHVKYKLRSSSLSHLFSQGAVSATLLCSSEEFRRRAEKRIQKEAEKQKVKKTFHIDPHHFDPHGRSVVYAIVADWHERDLVNALPFFSKVNLRRHAEDLERLGYQVYYRRVDIEKADEQAAGSGTPSPGEAEAPADLQAA